MRRLKVLLFCLVCLGLTACGEPMTNREIIDLHKECSEAGMRAIVLKQNFSQQPILMRCDRIPEGWWD